MIEGIKLGLIFAILIEALHFILVIYVGKHVKFKNKIVENLKYIVLFFLIAFSLYLIGSGIYIVREGFGVVLTQFGGEKRAMDGTFEEDIGLHYRFMGKTKEYDLRNNYIDYPPYPLITTVLTTSDDIALEIRATLFYKIIDLRKWAIENKDSDIQLASLFESSIQTNIKKTKYSELKNKSLDEIAKKELRQYEDILGIKIIDFKIKMLTESQDVLKSKQQAEAIKIQSEAKITEAENLNIAMEIQKNALYNVSPEILDYLSKIELYKVLKERQNSVIVVPDSEMGITIPKD